MLKKRVLTAIVALPAVVAAVWFDYPVHWFTILAAAVGAAGVFEFYRMVARAKVPPLAVFGVVWTVLAIVVNDSSVASHVVSYPSGSQLTVTILVSALVLPLMWMVARKGPKTEAFSRWVWTFAGIVYIGVLLGHFVAIRGMENGRNWVLFALLTTFASDTAAFLVGRVWGRRRLAPQISPAKSWEGAVAGVFGAIVIGMVFVPDRLGTVSNPLLLPPLGYWSAALLACLVSVFGQFGDLVESLFKRNTGSKDSGWLFPGHGGALDRIDSVVFAGVVVYYYLVWLIR